jgi:hypothetical protein
MKHDDEFEQSTLSLLVDILFIAILLPAFAIKDAVSWLRANLHNQCRWCALHNCRCEGCGINTEGDIRCVCVCHTEYRDSTIAAWDARIAWSDPANIDAQEPN